jgi:cytochrome c553
LPACWPPPRACKYTLRRPRIQQRRTNPPPNPLLRKTAAAPTAKTESPAGKPDLERAQKTASEVCLACHGPGGNSVVPTNPSLAGQPAEYISLQLAHFKAGVRVNPIMQGIASTLQPEDMRRSASTTRSSSRKPQAAKDAALVAAGQKIFRGGDMANGTPACSACHLPTGAGVAKNYPRVGGQHAEYTYAQLKAFKSGERGADKEGKDANGMIMATIAQRLSRCADEGARRIHVRTALSDGTIAAATMPL